MADFSLQEVLKIAKAQKGVIWCILANLVCIFIPLAYLVVLPFQMVFIYRLASGLRVGLPVLWVVGMFVPVLSLILLLNLSLRATKIVRAAGFEVGLMGANTLDIESKPRL